jgi:hypothetical protein
MEKGEEFWVNKKSEEGGMEKGRGIGNKVRSGER